MGEMGEGNLPLQAEKKGGPLCDYETELFEGKKRRRQYQGIVGTERYPLIQPGKVSNERARQREREKKKTKDLEK